MYSVSFGSSFVKKCFIQKKDVSGKYLPEKVALVELDCRNAKDLNFLSILAQYNGEYSYAGTLFEMAKLTSESNLKENQKNRILLLTSQLDDFENIKKEDVKGFIEYDIKNNKNIRINCFEGLQDNFFKKKVRKYKHIGKTLLNYVIKNEKPERITLHSTTYAKPFYISMGFRENPSSNSKYELEWIG